LGAAGERFAAWWLAQQGLRLIASNVEVAGGEIDLLMSDETVKVVVEVRSMTGVGDPIDAVDHSKRRHVRHLAGEVGASRVDYVGVGFRPWGVEVHWVPG
jgi:putative endonuclease